MEKAKWFRIAGLGIIAFSVTSFYSPNSTISQQDGTKSVKVRKQEPKETCIADFNGVRAGEVTAEQAQAFDLVVLIPRLTAKNCRIIEYTFVHAVCAPFIVTVKGAGITPEIKQRLQQVRPKDQVIISDVVYLDGKQERHGLGATYTIKFPPKQFKR